MPAAYADAVRASSPAFAEVMELAEGCGGGMLLIDTFDKSGGGLLDFLSVDGLWAVCEEASERGVRVALAGSLNAAAIAKLVDVPAAYVGVRGAACIGGRDGTIDLACVKSLVALVRGRRQKMAS